MPWPTPGGADPASAGLAAPGMLWSAERLADDGRRDMRRYSWETRSGGARGRGHRGATSTPTVRSCERLHKVGSAGGQSGSAEQCRPQAVGADVPEVVLYAVDEDHRDHVRVLGQISGGTADITDFEANP